MVRPVVGTVAYYVGLAWFTTIALIDRVLAHCPWRWST